MFHLLCFNSSAARLLRSDQRVQNRLQGFHRGDHRRIKRLDVAIFG